jgi:pimeloyl-ACP methyl ester carboxylesterase
MATALDAIVRRDDVRSELSSIAVPTLVIVGEEEREPGVPASAELAARIPDAQLAVLPMTGHLSALESPQLFESRLLSFLADIDAPVAQFDDDDPRGPG